MRKHLSLILLGTSLCAFDPAMAETDMEMQEKALKAREKQGAMDHSAHANHVDVAGQFRGVYYGYLPCREEDCSGLKMTLSLNPKHNYLLVIQPAKPQNRESFEKGKYQWDEVRGEVLLTPNREAPQRKLAIKDPETLVYLEEGKAPPPGEQDKYQMKRSDVAGNRERHIH